MAWKCGNGVRTHYALWGSTELSAGGITEGATSAATAGINNVHSGDGITWVLKLEGFPIRCMMEK